MRASQILRGVATVAIATMAVSARADDVPTGALVGGDIELLEVAIEEGGADWQLQTVAPLATPQPPDLRVLLESWDDADFPRCQGIAELLDVDALLRAGFRQQAAVVSVIQAGCAYKLGDLQEARGLARALLVRELDTRLALEAAAAPDFLSLLDEIRHEVEQLPRLDLTVQSVPLEARVRVDGAASCDRTPCTVSLPAGAHLIEVRAAGFEPQIRTIEMERSRAMQVRLVEAGPERARRHLALALAERDGLVGNAILSLAAQAFGARVVLFVERRGEQFDGALYDRGLARTIHTRTAQSDELVRALVQEWQGELSPPLRTRGWFWAVLAGAIVVAGTGLALGLALRPNDERFSIRFGRAE